MAMFYKNICRFDRCNLEFADLYDLIQHIEETHIPADSEKKSEMPLACAPLSAICRYYQKLPDQHARPVVPEATFQQPAPNIPSGAQAAAAMAAAAAAASVKKRIPSIIAQSSSASAVSGIMTSGGQSVPQTPVTPTTSILFHPPANVAARSSGTTPASSHISDGDDESMSVGRESLSSESSMIHEEGGGSETAPLYKIVSPTGSSEERRFVCTAPGCKKSYKNMNGIRYHIKMAHMNAATAEPQPNAKKFRCQCGKAYKTSHGLHNHMLQTHHRQAPVPSSNTISNPSMGNMNAPSGANSKYAVGMAGVSASASQFKRGLPISLMAGGSSAQTGNVSAPGQKQQPQGPQSSLNSAYYPQPPNLKSSGGGGGGGSSTTTLPSGVSVQVSNLGGGAPTTVQVGQQGALGVVGGSASSGGPVGPGPAGAQGLHISAGRRLSAAHHMQQHHMNSVGGRPLKIGSGGGGNIQGVVVSTPSAPGVNAYSSSLTSITTMGGSGIDKSDL